MTRRELLALAGACFPPVRALAAQHSDMVLHPAPEAPIVGPADVTLRIAETTLELGPRRFTVAGKNTTASSHPR